MIETGTVVVVAEHTETVDLSADQTLLLSFTPDTGDWGLGSYEVRFGAGVSSSASPSISISALPPPFSRISPHRTSSF